MSFQAPCHAYNQILMFVCFMPCLCVQIYMLVAMPCASKALLSLIIYLSYALGLIGGVQIQFTWSRPTFVHLGLYQRVQIISLFFYVFFLASMLYIHVRLFRSRLCHALHPLWACACQSLGLLSFVVAFVPFRACFYVTTCEIHLRGVGVFDTHLSPLCVIFLCLPCLLGATRLAFFASFATSHACLHVHA